METEFIYWRHRTPIGIKVEEVCGAENRSGKIWREMAMQVYQENGKDGYREVGHYSDGAPFLAGDESRISISHTDGLLVVATLPRTPEADLSVFSPRTAMGIDCEREDREQTLRVRDKFLSEREKELVAEDDVKGNVLAWTCKEALYKSARIPGIDFKENIRILSLPVIEPMSTGLAEIVGEDGKIIEMNLYSYLSEGCIVTIAYSPKCAKFMKNVKQF